MRRLTAVSFALLTIFVPQSASTVPVTTVLMSGLDNPRGLAFGPEGALYVAEAGRGGRGPCLMLRMALQCYGPTGAVSRLWRGVQERVATGLPSQVSPAGDAIGPQDVSFQGRGGMYVTVGFGGDPALRSAFGPAGANFGTLMHIPASGKWKVDVDVSQYELDHNPAGGPIDSNPFGVIAEPSRRLVVDAGANALLEIHANGLIEEVATFPSRPARNTDAVPTTAAVGPDGAYYIGELTGAPFNVGAARVYRVVPGNAPEIYLEGFKTIIDLAWGPDGLLYVLQHATGAAFSGPGQVIRVNANGTRTVVVDGLTRPTSLIIGPSGEIYVTNVGVTPGAGQVLKVVL